MAAFEARNPGIHIETELMPNGSEADNLVKTRLATGDMDDIFLYNSGALFQALNPAQNLLPVSDPAVTASLDPSFLTAVSAKGRLYGVPAQAAMGGGILYNRKIYAELGLSVPTTWEQFQANNARIKAAGKVPVIQTFKDTWTSQLFVLADFFNVQAADPGFATDYTENRAKFASVPAALEGFARQAEVLKAGYLNGDFASAGFEDGLRMLAEGKGAHYPMLSSVVSTIADTYPDKVDDVGFFALPGDHASSNGVTVWLPNAVYASKATKHPEESLRFLAFVASPDGCSAMTAAVGAAGPYLVKSCSPPADLHPAVADLSAYFKSPNTMAPALEFLSPVKGPSLEQITVEVGSGFRTPAEGAALYDQDVRKQALQLGLPHW